MACAVSATFYFFATGLPGAENPKASEAEQIFLRDIWPLFTDKCLPCHGQDEKKIKGGLDLRTQAGLLHGGDSGKPSLVPGKLETSLLWLAVTRTDEDLQMPPKENDRLTEAQLTKVRQWILGGAPWPNAQRKTELAKATYIWDATNGIPVKTSGGLSPEWNNRRYKPEDLWAYQPLKKPAVPARPSQKPAGNPIDAFLGVKLAQIGLAPAPPADRRTLIRRATFDLLGLPPTPEEIEAFVNNPAPDKEAFAQLVERLLASPHYGEQWGAHWLDVTRYADSSGFANDYERGNAWRYRDYVIRAFNADEPYNQFVREQLAGDELDPTNSELLVATGFLRSGPWELTAMEVPKVARQRYLDDVTDNVGQVFLAHALQCARCHDHKFDPVPTRDYYGFQAIFATTQLAERPAPFLSAENTAGFEEKQYLEERREYYRRILRELDEKSIASARQWYAEKQLPPAPFEAALTQVAGKPGKRNREAGYDAVRALLLKNGTPEAQVPPRYAGFTPQDYGMERVARKGLERLQWALERYEPFALGVYDGRTPDQKSVVAPVRIPANSATAGELEETCILRGGDPFSPCDKVSPSILSAVATLGGAEPITISTNLAGRRKALAEWIVSPRNPLTARVMANRIWQWHFNLPLAGNPNNFGSTGKKPTHPELLDWLAATFIESGWSIKAMHRLILSSDAYQRASEHPDRAQLAKKDSSGTAYAVFKPRRLTAEELRDATLSATGELNPSLGGIPARPELNLETALQPRQVMGTFAEAWQPSPRPEQRSRRSIYALKLRGLRDPFLEVFNQPSPELCCELRDSSTVTPQVFSLFNSQESYERALALAARVTRETTSRGAAVARAFALTFGRSAQAGEIAACLAHWDQMTARHRSVKLAEHPAPREVAREAVEENTGEKFSFREPLEFYADFVAGAQPAGASPELRGLAEVCLVLLNANEFVYVY